MNNRVVLIASVAAIAAAGLTTAVYAGSGAGGGAALAGPSKTSAVVSNCTTSKTDFVSADGVFTTTSTSFSVLLSKTVKISGTTSSCLVVTESSFPYAPGGRLEAWAAQVDGTLCSPNNGGQGVQAASNDGSYATQHTAQFICPGVSPGFHTVYFLYRSWFGDSVYAWYPTLRIEHK